MDGGRDPNPRWRDGVEKKKDVRLCENDRMSEMGDRKNKERDRPPGGGASSPFSPLHFVSFTIWPLEILLIRFFLLPSSKNQFKQRKTKSNKF